MRRFIFDKQGDVRYYLTGAGVLYGADNQAVAWLQDDALVSPKGELIGWFDGDFLWDEGGFLVGFVKGAWLEGLELPPTKPLTFNPTPIPAPFYPLLITRDKPAFKPSWSDTPLAVDPMTPQSEAFA